jgi:hypothetical protein
MEQEPRRSNGGLRKIGEGDFTRDGHFTIS